MLEIPEELYEFTATDCDRAAFIQNYLEKHNVKTTIIPIDGKRHIYVNFPASYYNPTFKIKTVLVHYDRVARSPGANDNSAAVFQVMDWAVRMCSTPAVYNVRIFFTDGEEMGDGGGVKSQGAFGIATLFKKLGITGDDVYVFDACGRGDIPVIAKTVLDIGVAPAFRARFNSLYERTQNLVRNAAARKWLILPVAYSDNAGFLACGIPAVAITMLPAEEADSYGKNLILHKGLERLVTNPPSAEKLQALEAAKNFDYRQLLPQTWQMFHTRQDTVGNLTPESFMIMARILDSLGADKSL